MSKEKTKVIILKEFRDKDNFAKIYKVDTEVEFEKSRAETLAALGLATLADKDSKSTNQDTEPVMVDLSKTWQQIRSDVKKSTDIEDLKVSLEKERVAEKPRESVVKDLKERINELSKPE